MPSAPYMPPAPLHGCSHISIHPAAVYPEPAEGRVEGGGTRMASSGLGFGHPLSTFFAVLDPFLSALVWVALVLLGFAGTSSAPGKDPEEPTDEELMVRYVAGDHRAFQKLMERHQRMVYGYIFKQYYNEDKASEIFQESFYKVIRGASSFDPTQRFLPWMFTIVKNTILDDYKKRKLKLRSLHEPFKASESDRSLLDIIPDTRSDEGEQKTRLRELQLKLSSALEKMNPDQRDVFLMRHEDGMQFEEIAVAVGCPVNTAKTRMRYALETLRRDLKEFLR